MNNAHSTFSGPVWIPKVFDGRNRLFFFLGYSQLWQFPVGPPERGQLHRANRGYAERRLRCRSCRSTRSATRFTIRSLRVPTQPARGFTSATRFPANRIPTNRISAPKFYDFYSQRMPVPNNDPTDPTREPVNNFLASGMPNNVFHRAFNNRIDYQASEKHRFFFRWLKTRFIEDAQDYTFGTEAGLMAWNERRPAMSGASTGPMR